MTDRSLRAPKVAAILWTEPLRRLHVQSQQVVYALNLSEAVWCCRPPR